MSSEENSNPASAFSMRRRPMRYRLNQIWGVLVNTARHLAGRSVVGEVPVVVCLTSYGKRLGTVYLTIESIAAGAVRPAQLILWVDDEHALRSLPRTIHRMMRRGLEVRVGGNYRSHNKWYPAVTQEILDGRPMVVADDEVYYPRRWLAALWSAHQSAPSVIWAHRAHQMRREGNGFAPYRTWTARQGTEDGHDVMATGVGGALYPYSFLALLRCEGERFMEIAPRADDVWLCSRAVKLSYPRAQVAERSLVIRTIIGSQRVTLNATNIADNDWQIAAAFADVDLEQIWPVSDNE